MKRLFLYLWIAMVLTVTLALVVDGVLWVLGSPEVDQRHLVEMTSLGVTNTTQHLRALPASSWPEALDEINQHAHYPVSLVKRGDVPASLSSSLEAQGWYSDEIQPYVFVELVPDGTWVRFGPMTSSGVLSVTPYYGFHLLVTVLLVAGLLGLLLRPTAQRLHLLEEAALAMAQGDLSVRVGVKPGSTTESLGQAFNKMAGRVEYALRARRHLLHAVSHELRTPLTRVRLGLHLLDDVRDEAFEDQKSLIHQDLDELDGLVTEVLATVRFEEGSLLKPESLGVEVLLQETIARHSIGEGVVVALVMENPLLHWPLDAVLFARAVGNLISNARRYAQYHVRVSTRQTSEGLEVVVDDDGPGITEDARERVLEAFVRADSSNEGYGLGLAIATAAVERHQGSLVLGDSVWGGCRASTVWPWTVGSGAERDEEGSV